MRRRHRRKNQKSIIIFSMIGLVCMFSVGYAAFSSEFLISGKGTIVEKTITSEKLKELVVINGDGLYKDPVEVNRYVYRGANPDNYIWLDLNSDDEKTDNEIYRIVAVEADNTIKVVAENSIGNMPFDPGYATVIDGVTSASSMEGTRYSNTSTDYCYYSASTTSYYGCNAWGSNTTTLDLSGNNVTIMPREVGNSNNYDLPDTEAYINTYLNTTFLNNISSNIQNKIMIHMYNVGTLKSTNGQTLETDILQESSYKWSGKIGLINVTDYVRASTNLSCIAAYEYNSVSECYNNSEIHNYLFHLVNEWTMTPLSLYASNGVWAVAREKFIATDNANGTHGVFPSFYLTSNINLKGKGTLEKPYEIVN